MHKRESESSAGSEDLFAIDRREFLKASGHSGLILLGATSGLALLPGCPSGDPNSAMSSHTRATLDKLADTILPPESGDGGSHARAAEILFDPYYGFNAWIDEAVTELDEEANRSYRKDFKTCDLAQRTAVLDYVLVHGGPWYAEGQYVPIFEAAISLTKLAFFGGLVNDVGTVYAGFPGPSGGYDPSGASAPNPRAGGSYYAPGLPIALADHGAYESRVSVSGTGVVRDLFITVVIRHARVADLVVALTSPSGTTATLHDRAGGSAADLYWVNRPVMAFDGQVAAGTWTLRVSDQAAGATGQLSQWALHLTAN